MGFWNWTRKHVLTVLGAAWVLLNALPGIKSALDWVGRFEAAGALWKYGQAMTDSLASVPPVLNLVFLAAGVALVWWDLKGRPNLFRLAQQAPTESKEAETAYVPPPPAIATGTTKPAVRAEPFYSRGDIERILEALYEISAHLQDRAVPAREAAQAAIQRWNSYLNESNNTGLRNELKRVKLMVDGVGNGGWAISNKYQ